MRAHGTGVLEQKGFDGEVLVADNASEDDSAALAVGGRRARGLRTPAAATAAPTWQASPPREVATS